MLLWCVCSESGWKQACILCWETLSLHEGRVTLVVGWRIAVVNVLLYSVKFALVCRHTVADGDIRKTCYRVNCDSVIAHSYVHSSILFHFFKTRQWHIYSNIRTEPLGSIHVHNSSPQLKYIFILYWVFLLMFGTGVVKCKIMSSQRAFK